MATKSRIEATLADPINRLIYIKSHGGRNFGINTKLLVAHSARVKRELEAGLDPQVDVLLADCPPEREVLKVLVKWLACGVSNWPDKGTEASDDFELLGKVYKLGIALEMPSEFMDEVMDLFFKDLIEDDTAMDHEEFTRLALYTFPRGSSGRQHLVEWLLYSSLANADISQCLVEICKRDDCLAEEIMEDLLKQRENGRDSGPAWDEDQCAFHSQLD